ncbi:ATP-dependent zinc metalloprotease FtsH [Lentisphaerota bacterium ZTH]|nr:ATP-dependent zinc metalloprotease FtsH [Lentisphaerota bacterium]WET06633.1 ATP-dependent zinc metalloprotease FtsH [Lentisphaerota bacterium ZTH]
MDDNKKKTDQEKPQDEQSQQKGSNQRPDRDPGLNFPGGFSPKRTSKAAFVWFLIFIIFGLLLIFKLNMTGKVEEWDQSKFEKELVAGNVKTAEVSSESDRILYVEGTYQLSVQDAAAVKGQTGAQPVGKYRSRVIYSTHLDQLLRSTDLKVKSKDNWWSLLITILPVLLVVGLLYFLFSRQMKMAGRGAMQFGKSRARMILPSDLKVTFDDIAGADEAKEETKEIIDFLKDPLKFQLVGGRIPKGCLLMGAPGTGKTLLAKAVACEANVPFFSISGSDFVEMFVGVGASRVRDMFEQARKNTPCLIFIDEIDAVGRSRFSGMGGGHDEREQTLNAMLVEMDGLESRSGVIVLAATNRPDVLDPALLRPGRFDRQIVLDLPDIIGRRKIFDVHTRNIRIDESVNLDTIAKSTPGLSGADIANLCNEAALLAARDNREAVNQQDMEEARDKVRWGRERRSRRISERERRLTAFHEGGHTLVAMHCKHATPVHKVTIIPRGRAYLGATLTMPEEDVYTQSQSELIDELAVLMGGRAAEQLIFNEVTTGASSDIERASHMARMMVCRFGMNDVIGPIQYGETHEQVHVRVDSPPQDAYSQETAREIDIEVKKLLIGASERARNILTENAEELEKLAKELLEKETLSVSEVRELLGIPEPEGEDHLGSDTVGPEALTGVDTADHESMVETDTAGEEGLVTTDTQQGFVSTDTVGEDELFQEGPAKKRKSIMETQVDIKLSDLKDTRRDKKDDSETE